MDDFHHWARLQPDRVVLTMADSGVQFTAAELSQRSTALAQWLAAQGLVVGDAFAVLLENRPEVIELVQAARLAGLYAAVISTRLTEAEVAYIVRDSQARLLVVSATSTPLAATARAQDAALRCWTVDDTDDIALPSLNMAVQAHAASGSVMALDDRLLGRDLLYSSGTTGRPKGVKKPLSSPEYRHTTEPEVAVWKRHMQFDETAIYLSPAPLYHAAPLRYTLRTLDVGGAAVIMGSFDAEKALALIARYGITHSQWVPTMLGRLLKLPETVKQQYDLRSHRIAIHAAAPCPVAVKQGILDWWGDIVLEYYAGSEGCGTTLINSQEWRARPGSVGRAITGQLHIVGDDGVELPSHAVGHVYFSGGSAFEYLNDADKTRAAYNDRGWATYGDIGAVDADGFLFLSDRRADLILAGGVNVYPQEIELALARHPAVDEVAVVGVPDEDLGELPMAAIVLRPGHAADADTAHAIVASVADELSRLKWPSRVAFVPALPRLETGKLLRRVLKERFREAPDTGYALDSERIKNRS